MGLSVADTMAAGRWGPSVPQTQATAPVTDLTMHVTGGNTAQGGTNSTSAPSDKMVLNVAAGYVLASIVLLVLLGAVVFRSARG